MELTVQIDVSILWAYWVGFAPSIGPLVPQPPYQTLPNQRMVHGKLQGKAPNPKTSDSQAHSCYSSCLVSWQLLGLPVNKYFGKI